MAKKEAAQESQAAKPAAVSKQAPVEVKTAEAKRVEAKKAEPKGADAKKTPKSGAKPVAGREVPIGESAANSGALQLEPHQVILRPLVTEKGMHKSSRLNAYAFEVSQFATKEDVRRAVEELFNVRVLRVNTQNHKGKPRRTRYRMGYTGQWKKAVVKLDAEHRIDFF